MSDSMTWDEVKAWNSGFTKKEYALKPNENLHACEICHRDGIKRDMKKDSRGNWRHYRCIKRVGIPMRINVESGTWESA